MKRRLKSFAAGRAGWILPVVIWLLAGARAEAAGEKDALAFKTATAFFQQADWPRAEKYFTNFLKTFPESPYYADVVLYEAQAIFKQAKTSRLRSYDEVIQLLAAEQSKATNKVDDFTYWTAKAWYGKTDYGQAAQWFENLAQGTNSDLRPEALYSAAYCYAQLKDWVRVMDRLQPPESGFQQLVKTNPTNEFADRGLLLLGEAELTQKHYDGAEAAWHELPAQKPGSELEWRRQDLWCRIKLESGHPDLALLNSANLLAAAGDDAEARAKSILLVGGIYRDQEQFTNALKTYATNLISGMNTPEPLRREALQNSVDVLNRALNRADEAVQMLSNYLAAYPSDNNSDFHRLVLGELRLKQAYQTAGGGTNLLQARANFEKIITDYPTSVYLGKAYLGLGWCLLTETNLPGSQAAFSNAVANLPSFPNDRATARFKLADTLFQQADYPEAIGNYEDVVDEFASFPLVTNNLFEPALYQILRAGIETSNLTVASNALDRILKWFPDGFLGDRSLLLLGEAESQAGNAAAARDLFVKFRGLWPDSPLQPQVELAMARTYERQGKWANAVQVYYGWIAGHTNSDALPLAEFSLAWAEFKAGQETNALRDFSNFTTRYPTNELSAKAWYWMGDYYRRQGTLNAQLGVPFFETAESNYQNVYLRWPASDLRYHAQMEAGRTAALRESYAEAAGYFTNLVHEPKCPPDLKMEAAFACGDANSLANNFTEATNWFYLVATTYTNNAVGINAWNRMGDSCRQLAAQAGFTNNQTNAMSCYLTASNAYQTVLTPPLLARADITNRSLAYYGLGMTLEGMARLKTGDERTNLLGAAVDTYLKVVNQANLNVGEQPDPIVLRDAGLAVGNLYENELGRWDSAIWVYQKLLGTDLPPLKELQAILGKRIENARKHLAPDKSM